MAKRFTDTDKWKRPWFRSLDSKARWFWIYLLDNCDNTGVWIADFDLASFQLGFKVSEDFLIKNFNDKLIRYSQDKFFIPSFVDFQYGELNPANNAHKPVLKVLQKVTANKDLMSPSEGAQDKDKDKDMDMDKDISLKSAEKLSLKDFELIYDAYPRKIGKSEGLKKLKAEIKQRDVIDLAHAAAKRYSDHCRENATEPKYIMHFSTFANRWRDWIDPEVGKVTLPKEKSWLEDYLEKHPEEART